MLGVAVGSQTLKVLLLIGDARAIQWQGEELEEPITDTEATEERKKDSDVLTLPYDQEGLQILLGMADAISVALAGNRNWAKPLAYALARHGKDVRYFTPRKTERGKVLSQVNFLRTALEHGLTGKPFFGTSRKIFLPEEEPVAHPWVELEGQYSVAMDDLRRVKHRILNQLRMIFPELLSLETKLWGKKAIAALAQEKYGYFGSYGLEWSASLARYIPGQEQAKAQEELRRLFTELQEIENREASIKEEIYRLTKNHPIALMFEGSDSAKRLTLLIGWQEWGTTKKDFLQLRKYAGLAVSRIDSKGNPRISRERPAIRTNLYFLLRTSEGKRIIEDATTRLNRELKKKPKRMEILLKEIWRKCLQDSQ